MNPWEKIKVKLDSHLKSHWCIAGFQGIISGISQETDTVRIKVQVGKSKKKDLRQWTIKGASFHRRIAGRGRYTKALSFQVTTGFIEVMENLESRGI